MHYIAEFFKDAFLGYKNYFNFKGKTTQFEYWSFVVFVWLFFPFALLFFISIVAIFSVPAYEYLDLKLQYVPFCFWAFSVIPSISIMARRLREAGKNPFLLIFACLSCCIGIIVIGILPSSKDSEQTYI